MSASSSASKLMPNLTRVLLLFPLLLVLWSAPAVAGVAFLREGHNDKGAAGTTLTITVTINAGDDVVVLFTTPSGGEPITSVLDNNSVAYTSLGSGGDNTNVARVFGYGLIDAPAATSIVITIASAVTANGVVLVYSGGTAFGNTATLQTTSSTNPSMSATTQDNDNIVAGMFATITSVTNTAQTGTIRLNDYNLNQASRVITAVDNTAATPQSVTISFTCTPAGNWGAFAVELRAAAGAARQRTLLGVGT